MAEADSITDGIEPSGIVTEVSSGQEACSTEGNNANPTGEIKVPQDNNLTGEEDIEKVREQHRHEEKMTEYGAFGKYFGTEVNSSKNLTFTIVLAILVMIFSISLLTPSAKFDNDFIIKLFEMVLPIITLAFGYFFGKQD